VQSGSLKPTWALLEKTKNKTKKRNKKHQKKKAAAYILYDPGGF